MLVVFFIISLFAVCIKGKEEYICGSYDPINYENVEGKTPKDTFTGTALAAVQKSSRLQRAFDLTNKDLDRKAYKKLVKWNMRNATVESPKKQAKRLTRVFEAIRDHLNAITHAKIIIGSFGSYLTNEGVINKDNAAELARQFINFLDCRVCCVDSNQDYDYYIALGDGYQKFARHHDSLNKNFATIPDLYQKEAIAVLNVEKPLLSVIGNKFKLNLLSG